MAFMFLHMRVLKDGATWKPMRGFVENCKWAGTCFDFGSSLSPSLSELSLASVSSSTSSTTSSSLSDASSHSSKSEVSWSGNETSCFGWFADEGGRETLNVVHFPTEFIRTREKNMSWVDDMPQYISPIAKSILSTMYSKAPRLYWVAV